MTVTFKVKMKKTTITTDRNLYQAGQPSWGQLKYNLEFTILSQYLIIFSVLCEQQYVLSCTAMTFEIKSVAVIK